MTSVKLTDQHQPNLCFDDDLPLGHEVVDALQVSGLASAEVERGAQDELRYLRGAIRTLIDSTEPADEDKLENINRRFYEDNVSLLRQAPAYTKTKKILSWLSRAPYAELQEFCEWNVDRAQLLQQQVATDTPQIHELVRARLDTLKTEVSFPKQAMKAFEKALKELPRLHTMDSFAAAGRHSLAYFSLEGAASKIVLSNLYGLRAELYYAEPEMIDVVFHEYMHASGYLCGAGFLGRSPEMRRYLEETIVSHATAVSATGGAMPDTFNPTIRPKAATRPGHYWDERHLFSLTEQYGPVSLRWEDVIAGYYNLGQRGSARKHLLQAVDRNIKVVVPLYRHSGIRRFCWDYEAAFDSAHQPFMQRVLKNAQKQADKKRFKLAAEGQQSSRAAAVR